MIIVDVIVPSIGRKYNFSLDEELRKRFVRRKIVFWMVKKKN